MSVSTPVIDHVDGPTRRIYLLAGVREFHPVADIYTEVRNLRRTNESLRQYDSFVSAGGNDPKGGGKFTPRFLKLLLGTKIVPADEAHSLLVTGEVFTDDPDTDPDVMDFAALTAGVSVFVDYRPSEAELIAVGGGNYLDTDRTRDDEVHRAHFNPRTWNKGTDTMTIFAADGVTPLHTFDTNDDASDIRPQ